jgi:putative membrane protein insertion efficiency factor
MKLLRWLSAGVSTVLIAFVRFYQIAIGPWFPKMCRFEPSCSVYMIEAIRRRGPAVGVLKGLWRLLRCNPFFRGGYDPVE